MKLAPETVERLRKREKPLAITCSHAGLGEIVLEIAPGLYGFAKFGRVIMKAEEYGYCPGAEYGKPCLEYTLAVFKTRWHTHQILFRYALADHCLSHQVVDLPREAPFSEVVDVLTLLVSLPTRIPRTFGKEETEKLALLGLEIELPKRPVYKAPDNPTKTS